MYRKFFEKLEALGEWGGTRRDILFLVLGGLALAFSLANDYVLHLALPFDSAWVAVVLCGTPILIAAVTGLALRFDIKADVLVAMALIASLIIGEYFAAGEVAFIMQLGAFLEDWTVARSRRGMEHLVKLSPQTARVLRNGVESVVNAKDVKLGDICRVLPGETIPVDGVITAGRTSINQAALTGESMPVDKAAGDEVLSGTVNRFGAFEMRALKVGEESSIQRMVRLVESADAGKAKIVGIADRMATWVVVTALAAAGLTWFFTGEVIRAVTILVVFCPCALVLATPTAIVAAIGNLTHRGILVKEGDALERMANVSKIAFDKTGTLTFGKPKVVHVAAFDSQGKATDMTEFYRLVASAEKNSEHPLGKAIVESFSDRTPLLPSENFQMYPGQGIEAIVVGKKVYAGNLEFIANFTTANLNILEVKKFQQQGATITYAVVENGPCGFIALEDTLRDNVKNIASELRSADMEPVLLSGDNLESVRFIANKLDIREFKATCTPENKLSYVRNKTAMIGDGINDAPALKASFVGIAMGGVGSDIAIEAADITLVHDDIAEIPHLVKLSKKMMQTIKRNIAFSMTLNFVAIALAISGVLNPVVGALVHNAGSIVVIVNSSLLLKWRQKGKK